MSRPRLEPAVHDEAGVLGFGEQGFRGRAAGENRFNGQPGPLQADALGERAESSLAGCMQRLERYDSARRRT